jgi:transposase
VHRGCLLSDRGIRFTTTGADRRILRARNQNGAIKENSAKLGHEARQQTCLAHLKRKARFADENRQGFVAWRIRTWLDGTFALTRHLGPWRSTMNAPRRPLHERDLDAILAEPTTCPLAAEPQG